MVHIILSALLIRYTSGGTEHIYKLHLAKGTLRIDLLKVPPLFVLIESQF